VAGKKVTKAKRRSTPVEQTYEPQSIDEISEFGDPDEFDTDPDWEEHEQLADWLDFHGPLPEDGAAPAPALEPEPEPTESPGAEITRLMTELGLKVVTVANDTKLSRDTVLRARQGRAGQNNTAAILKMLRREKLAKDRST
jgi:hypothetical protein